MEERYTSLQILGYDKRPINNTLVTFDGRQDKIAVIFPGIGYTAVMPLLYYTAEALMNNGYAALLVNYDYSHERFRALSDAKKIEWLNFDGKACYDAAISADYKEVLLVGKSLGGFALSHLSEIHKGKTIWMTPLLRAGHAVRGDVIYPAMKKHAKGNLFVMGTSDPNYDEGRVTELKKLGGKLLVVDGANHSMEIDGSPEKSLDVLKKVLKAVAEFA